MARSSKGDEKTVSMDDPIFIGIIVIGLYASIWALWHFGHRQIATAYGWLRYIEFYLPHKLGQMADLPLVRSLHGWVGTLCAPDAGGMCRRDFSTVRWSEIADSSLPVNIVLLIVLVLYCVRMFIKVNRHHPKIRFAKAHSIGSFVAEQKQIRDPRNGRLLYPQPARGGRVPRAAR